MEKREIKFRAWDKESKTMRDWESLCKIFYNINWYKDNTKENKMLTMFTDFNFEIMQYTGLKDKNNKEIYEGDILQWCNTTNVKSKWVVKDTPGGWNPFIDDCTTDKPCRYEVIGNVYENKDILPKKEAK